MWELDPKEGWVAKNSCFQIVVLEKPLSPLNCKEIKPVNPIGNQSWIFLGRTDDEAEALMFWPPDAKNWLIEKYPDTGKYWRQEEKQMTGWSGRMASPIWWAWVWASSGSWWWTGKPGMLRYLGFQSPWTQLRNWTELNCFCFMNSDRFWYWQNICYSCPSCLSVLLAFLTSDLGMLLLLFNTMWVKSTCPTFQQKFFEVLCDSTILLSSLLWAWWHPK